MNNKRATKRALLTSVMALVMCVVMLVGTTFAWFTDTASTGVNKIQAGNLDVDIIGEDGKSLDGMTLSFKNVNDKTDILWEPGATFFTQGFQIVNKGNLALKYKVVVSGTTGDAKLLEAIDFAVVTDDTKKDAEAVSFAEEGKLLNKGDTAPESAVTDTGAKAYYYLRGHMKEEAGNEYKNLTMDGISITVYATQYTHENDSFGPDYDKNATYYPVIDLAGLKDALGKGGNITIAGNFTGDATKTEASDRLTIKTPTTLNFEGVYTVPGSLETSSNWAALYITDETTINAIDGAGIICEDKTDSTATYIGGPYVADINAPGKTVTVNGGTYYGGCTTFQVTKGTLVVNGGFFQVTPDNGTGDCRYTLNCIDANYGNGSAKIIVKGGTFVNFDPSDSASENPRANFVPDGYSVISETKANGEVWYTVVKGTGVVPSTQESLNDGITNSTNKDVTVVMPTNTTFTLDNDIANSSGSDNNARNVTFVGDGTQTVDVVKNAITAEGGELNYQRGSTFTFENLTIQAGEGNFDGIVCNELTYKNCTIKGKLTLYGKATFIDCVFDNTMGNQYSIWTWGGTDVTFKNCTFNTNGKAILLYGQATASNPTNLVVNKCIFNDRNNGTAGKAAIEIGNDYNATYTLTVNNATVNGFADGKNTGSKLWANKNSMDAAHLSVTIDGNKVQ